MSTSGRAGGGDARPHVDGAEAFQALKMGEDKKPIVQRLERAVVAGHLKLTLPQRERCAVSPWDLDRIVLYLVDEHDKDHYDYAGRLLHVRHEVERVRTKDFESSLMPLSYALGAFLELLTDRPKYVNELRKDARVFSEFLEDLRDNPHLDEKGQVKRDLGAILALTGSVPKVVGQGPKAAVGDDPKSFWTSLPGVLTGVAAVITAVGGLYLAIKPRAEPLPEPPGAITLLTVDGVELFPARNGVSAKVTVEINGTEFVYPSAGGVEWLPVSPAMSPQQFSLPASKNGYQVRLRLMLLTKGGTEEYFSLETRFVTHVPFEDKYALQPRNGSGRAVVSYSIYKNPHLQIDSVSPATPPHR